MHLLLDIFALNLHAHEMFTCLLHSQFLQLTAAADDMQGDERAACLVRNAPCKPHARNERSLT